VGIVKAVPPLGEREGGEEGKGKTRQNQARLTFDSLLFLTLAGEKERGRTTDPAHTGKRGRGGDRRNKHHAHLSFFN